MPEASFAGAAETFLNVRGEDALLRAVHQCFASLFTDRAISYRARQGFPQLKVALSVGVMPMVRSDLASSGVIFTLDTESGFRDVVTITGSYGLGELVVQGVVTPDEWLVFKPTLRDGYESIVGRRLGSKEVRLVYATGTRSTRSEATTAQDRARYCLTDSEVLQLARWACLVEQHYSELARHPQPMDIEWAKDGLTGELFIVQARPETVHSAKRIQASAEVYHLQAKTGSATCHWTSRRGKDRRRVRSYRHGCEQVTRGPARRSARRAKHRSGLGTGDAARRRDCYRSRWTNGARRHCLTRVRDSLHRRHGQRDAGAVHGQRRDRVLLGRQ